MRAIAERPGVEDWNDSRLLHGWRRGDAEAGRELFARHYDTVYRFFDSKIKQDVLELVEGTFRDCVCDAEGETTDVRVVLLMLATARLYDYFRLEHVLEGGVATEAVFDPANHPLQALGGHPSTMICTEPGLRLLREVMPRIPLGEQILLELCFEERLSVWGLARVLGVAANTFPLRLESAWKHLEHELNRLEHDEEAIRATRTALRDRLDEARRRHSWGP